VLLANRVKAAVPVVLERLGLPAGEVAGTSVPNLRFPVEADGATWTATCNPLAGSVTGKPAEEVAEPLSTRRFLLRLHTAHGFPGAPGPRWYWAIIVDAMAAVMVFWGLSGLLMWWQIKATRGVGLLLTLSAALATVLVLGMHAALTQ